MSVTVRTLNESEVDALHCHYKGETGAQPCFVEIDLEADVVFADYNAIIGNGVPMNVFHSRALRYPIPCLTAKAANAFLEEIKPLAERICAGASIEWDGHNRVGSLDDDAQAASDELSERCERLAETATGRDVVMDWDADEFYADDSQAMDELGITAETTDEQLAEMARKAEREALTDESFDSPMVLHGIEEYLTRLRAELRED